MNLRTWQRACVSLALEKYMLDNHFQCLATPGAGKTVMAAELAAQLFQQDKIDFVLCFAPSLEVVSGIQGTLANRLNNRFDGKIGSLGGVYTYQSMGSLTDDFWSLIESHRVLVIFDEIHHCSGSSLEGANVWGKKILRKIKSKATFTLSLTGTPWRSDYKEIVLAEYCDSKKQVINDYVYGINEAISDGVCRKPSIVLIDNERLRVTTETEEIEYSSLAELFTAAEIRYQELLNNDQALKYCLSLAIDKLDGIRLKTPSAGGLVVASSIQHAKQIAEIIEHHFNKSVSVVTYKHRNAPNIIEKFRRSTTEWIVSVGMISEGTDIPRLQVCCHLSRVKTELYFRQILGRILRSTSKSPNDAWLYTFAEPKLVQFAKRLADDIPTESVISYESMPSEFESNNERNEMSNLFKENDKGRAISDGPDLIDRTLDLQNSRFSSDSSEIEKQDFDFEVIGAYRQKLIEIFEQESH